jgi:hypothetical protein
MDARKQKIALEQKRLEEKRTDQNRRETRSALLDLYKTMAGQQTAVVKIQQELSRMRQGVIRILATLAKQS